MVDRVLFLSKEMDWETPQDLFDFLDGIFHFTLDPAASHENAKCPLYFTEGEDGLSRSWAGHRCFVNPPYGHAAVEWVKKAYEETDALSVMLLANRSGTKWFHDYALRADELWFVRGRIRFLRGGHSPYTAPFPSVVVVFGPERGTRPPVIRELRQRPWRLHDPTPGNPPLPWG